MQTVIYDASIKKTIELKTISASPTKVICYLPKGKDLDRLNELLSDDNFMSLCYDMENAYMIKAASMFSLDGFGGQADAITFSVTDIYYKTSCKGYTHPLHRAWLESDDPVHKQIKILQGDGDYDPYRHREGVSKSHERLVDNHIRNYLDRTVMDNGVIFEPSPHVFYYKSLSNYARALFIAKGLIERDNWETYLSPANTPVEAEFIYGGSSCKFCARSAKTKMDFYISFDEVEKFYHHCQKFNIRPSNIFR